MCSHNTSQIHTFQNNLRANCTANSLIFFFFTVATLYNGWVVLFASSKYLSTHFFAWPSMSKDQESTVSASGFPEALVGSFSFFGSNRNNGFEHTSVVRNNIFCWFNTLFECNPNIHGQQMMLVLQVNVFHENFPSRFYVFCLTCHFDIVHIHW